MYDFFKISDQIWDIATSGYKNNSIFRGTPDQLFLITQKLISLNSRRYSNLGAITDSKHELTPPFLANENDYLLINLSRQKITYYRILKVKNGGTIHHKNSVTKGSLMAVTKKLLEELNALN
mgnify:CR=1 FL=1